MFRVLCCLALGAVFAHAQNADSSMVSFHGTSTLYGQAANKPAIGSLLPKDFVRWNLGSTLAVYGVPLSINAMVTSEQRGTDQTMDYFSIGLDQADLQARIRQKIADRLSSIESLKDQIDAKGIDAVRDSLRALGQNATGVLNDLPNLDKLRDLQNLRDSELSERMADLQSLGLASEVQGFTSIFQRLILGSAFPQYSQFTLNGLGVTGVDVEVNPGLFYGAITAGRTSEASSGYGASSLLLATGSYKQNLVAARLGMGKKDGTHLFFTGLVARDQEGSLTLDSTMTGLTPEVNTVYGTEGQVLLLDDRLTVEGEAAVSVLTSDLTAGGDPSDEVPSWICGISSTNQSSQYDYAVGFQSSYNITESGTKIAGAYRRVGPGFYSLGVPYLRNDQIRYEGKVEQAMLKRQLTAAITFKHDEDNLKDTKRATSTVNAFGAELSANFRGYPYVRAKYAPLSTRSQRDADSLKIQTDVMLFSLQSGYTFRTENGLTSSTVLTYVHQEGKTLTGVGTYRARNGLLSQTVSLHFPLSFNLAFGAVATDLEATSTTVVMTDFTASYVAWDVWQIASGVSLMRDATRRTAFLFNSSVPLGSLAVLTLSYDHSLLDEPASGLSDYEESVLRVTLSKTW